MEQPEQARPRLRGPAGRPAPHTPPPHTPPPHTPPRTHRPRTHRPRTHRPLHTPPRRARAVRRQSQSAPSGSPAPPCALSDHGQHPRRRHAATEHAQADPGRRAVRREEGRRGLAAAGDTKDTTMSAVPRPRCCSTTSARPHAGGAAFQPRAATSSRTAGSAGHSCRLRERLPRGHVVQRAADERGALLRAARGPPLRPRPSAPARRHAAATRSRWSTSQTSTASCPRNRSCSTTTGPARAYGVDGRRPDPHRVEQLGLRALPRLPARDRVRHALHLPHLAARALRLLGAAQDNFVPSPSVSPWSPPSPRPGTRRV